MSDSTDTDQLNDRARILLKALVEDYIRDGQPVASRRLSKASGIRCSPATVRNVMADLEDLGFISAPHTSAGRVPTVKGYRCFVDTLLAVQPLTRAEVERLTRRMAPQGPQSAKDIVRAASSVLSNLTHLAGVVTVPNRSTAKLSQIDFVRLGQQRILVILVFGSREIQNRIVELDRELSDDELRQASNYLTSKLAGADIETVREQLLNELDKTRNNLNQMMLDAITLAGHAMAPTGRAEGEFVFAGETHLMEFAELSNVDKLRRLFEAFNEQRDILHLLDQSLTADGVEIFIGEESGQNLFDDCSVVTAPYRVNDDVVGVLGVIGPTRMAYERIIPIVDLTAKLVASALNSRN